MFNSNKDEKLEVLKDMLGTRTGYAEAVSNLSLIDKEKDIFLRASIEVKKDRPNKEIIEEAYTILVSKSLDMNENELNTSPDENTIKQSDITEKIKDTQEKPRQKVMGKKSNLLKYALALALTLILIAMYLSKNLLFNRSVDIDKINFRNGLVYEINTEEPFTGIVVRQTNDKQKIEETGYKDGKVDGTSTKWYDNGQKEEEENYKNEKLDGTFKIWNEDGQKVEYSNYKDGKLDGTATKWYDNGQKKVEAGYKDGKLDGTATEWYDNGQKEEEENYKNGKLDGTATEWYDNGQKEEEAHYKNGKLDRATEWWNDGSKKKDNI